MSVPLLMKRNSVNLHFQKLSFKSNPRWHHQPLFSQPVRDVGASGSLTYSTVFTDWLVSLPTSSLCDFVGVEMLLNLTLVQASGVCVWDLLYTHLLFSLIWKCNFVNTVSQLNAAASFFQFKVSHWPWKHLKVKDILKQKQFFSYWENISLSTADSLARNNPDIEPLSPCSWMSYLRISFHFMKKLPAHMKMPSTDVWLPKEQNF